MNYLVFHTEAYAYFAKQLAHQERYTLGTLTSKTFPDGERYHRITSDVKERYVVLVGGTIDAKSTLELYDLACGLVHGGVARLILCIPYFGYSTMERAIKQGEIVKAKNRARLFSTIPNAYLGNEAIFVDLHVSGIEHYLEGELHSTHLYAKKIIMEAAQELAGTDDFVLAATDAGRAKWVESLANDMGISAAFVYKKRLSGSETQVTGINADVKGKTVVLYDDMIRTGGSLVKAAQAYLDSGAKEIYALATHGVFPEGALERIESSQAIRKVIVTDTHPNGVRLAAKSDFIEIRSVIPLIETVIR